MEVIHELMSQCGPRSKRRMRRVRTECGEVGRGQRYQQGPRVGICCPWMLWKVPYKAALHLEAE